jgi:hypothetical protein
MIHHVFLRALAARYFKLPGRPFSALLAGDGVIHHFRRRYHGTLILTVGIDRKHGAELVREGFGDLIAFGRDRTLRPGHPLDHRERADRTE